MDFVDFYESVCEENMEKDAQPFNCPFRINHGKFQSLAALPDRKRPSIRVSYTVDVSTRLLRCGWEQASKVLGTVISIFQSCVFL